jgi:hypothetical protein
MNGRNNLSDDPLWYKDAIFYEVRVRSFYDSSGDGIGDFRVHSTAQTRSALGAFLHIEIASRLDSTHS